MKSLLFLLFVSSIQQHLCLGDEKLNAASNKPDCIHCICKVESGCRPLDCHMDGGSLSCGYFQIKKAYYTDCYMPGKRSGESVDMAWKRCSKDYNCSIKCVQAYAKRYSGGCNVSNQCEKMSRLHNGGPAGCRMSATVGYWNKVKKCMG